MILFDTETTGLVEPSATPIENQPRIIEFAAIKYNDSGAYKEVDRIEFKCNPGIPLPEKITEITGLTDDDVKGEPRFEKFIPALCDFFLGERYLIGHNVAFDVDLLRFDLARAGRLWKFPWPPEHICTVVSSMSYTRRRLRLHELHTMAVGHPHEGAHRAMADVEALAACTFWLIKEGKIKIG